MNLGRADLPPGASPEAGALHGLFGATNLVAWVLCATVLVPLLVVAWRARSRRGASRELGPRGRALLQAAFVVVPAIGLTWLGAASLATMQQVAPPASTAPLADLQVRVVAHQWAWEVHLPNGTTELNVAHLPVGARVDLNVTSMDVIHAVFLPDLGVKVDAVPGRFNHMAFTAAQPGTFTGACAQFCGVGHARMPLTVVVS